MGTIKIKVSKTEETEKEIQLPHYRKSMAHYFKIFSNEHCICITPLEGHYAISQSHAGLAFNATDSTESNAEEFNQAFNAVKEKLEEYGINNA